MCKDLCSGSSEEYWRSEGNNKRMRCYYKVSLILKVIKKILILGLLIYCLYLSTNTIFCLFDRFNCCHNNQLLINLVDIKKFVFNTYIITFIILLFVVFYLSRKNKYNAEKMSSVIIEILLFLPTSSLLTYNFMLLESLMRSFYLFIVFVVIVLSINFVTDKIDRLYGIAIGSTEEHKNRKGDKKVCKEK